jgi:uncharacterized damage-inducible protein DinB
MSESERIKGQIAKAFTAQAWYGPALMEVLAGVDATTAAAHPIPGGHSIWEILLHIRYGQQLMINRVQGSQAKWDLTADWPAVGEASDAAWQGLLNELARGEEELGRVVAAFPEARLDEPVLPDAPTMYDNLQGYAQHHAYHAGQITMLKKAAGSGGAQ